MVNFLKKSLQSLCIRSVTDNFDRFCAAYSKADDETLQYYLEFLQRKYSHEILQNLADDDALKNEHLNFVINKYTKELNFRIFTGRCDYTMVCDRLKDVGSAVVKFSLTDERNWQTLNRVLCCLSSVEDLNIKNTSCSDESLKIIAENCQMLRSLDLFGCSRVTNRGLEMLYSMRTTLQSLNIEETSVSHRGVAQLLKQVPSLQQLHYENVPQAIFEAVGLNNAIRENGIFHDAKFNLTNIVINNNPMRPVNHLTFVLKVCTTFCSSVKDLFVHDVVSEKHLRLCSSFANLEVVSLGCSFMVDNLCTNDFIRLSGNNLHTLRLTSFSISVEVLARYCPNLQCLCLASPTFQCFSETRDCNLSFPSLKTININRFSPQLSDDCDSAAFLISSSPNLETLNLLNCHLIDAITDAILNCPQKLKVINLSSSAANVIFLQKILRTHRTLVQLIIENTGILSAQYESLLDMAEALNSDVDIVWSDYSEIVRKLFLDSDSSDFSNIQRQLIKL